MIERRGVRLDAIEPGHSDDVFAVRRQGEVFVLDRGLQVFVETVDETCFDDARSHGHLRVMMAIGSPAPALAWSGKALVLRGSSIACWLNSCRNCVELSYTGLRARMIEPSGWCAARPCHGLKDRPSSRLVTLISLQADCGCTLMRATATYELWSSGQVAEASSTGIASRSVQSCTRTSHSPRLSPKKSTTASRRPLGLPFTLSSAPVKLGRPGETGAKDWRRWRLTPDALTQAVCHAAAARLWEHPGVSFGKGAAAAGKINSKICLLYTSDAA